jgi:hypothetical protein
MKRALLLLLCAGCSHTHVYLESRAGSAGSGAQGSVQVRTHSGPDLVTLIGLAVIAATIVDSERESLRTRSDPFWTGPVPPLDPSRAVTEHDCTRPIAEYSGNLRCR